MSIPFRYEDEVAYGVVATLTPLIRRVVAHNPSAFTYHGTGTYIIGHGRVAVVDPRASASRARGGHPVSPRR